MYASVLWQRKQLLFFAYTSKAMMIFPLVPVTLTAWDNPGISSVAPPFSAVIGADEFTVNTLFATAFVGRDHDGGLPAPLDWSTLVESPSEPFTFTAPVVVFRLSFHPLTFP